MPTRIADVTDKNQDERESAEYDGGIPVHTGTGSTKVITKGTNPQTAERILGTVISSNAGIVLPHDDAPGRLSEELIGRAP